MSDMTRPQLLVPIDDAAVSVVALNEGHAVEVHTDSGRLLLVGDILRFWLAVDQACEAASVED